MCPLSFGRSWDLKEHKESIHEGKKTARLADENSVTNESENHSDVRLRDSNENTENIYNTCGNKYSTKKILQRHMKMHKEINLFICQEQEQNI